MTARAARWWVGLPLALAAGCSQPPPGFDGPEAVVHDPVADVYLVSNGNGPPLGKDGNGYIGRVRPDGSMDRHWILGGRGGVVLHAPKGLALCGEVLWVADIDVLRQFDRGSGRPLGEVAIPGASCLQDVAAAPDGTVYCSDRGVGADSGPTGTDAIWRIAPGAAPAVLAQGPDLGQPSGLVASATGVFCVSWRDGSFYQIDGKGRRTDLGKAPKAQLDGLVRLEPRDGAPGVWLATSWAGECIYRFDMQGGCTALAVTFPQPADCGYDARRGRLLVPLRGLNRLEMLQP